MNFSSTDSVTRVFGDIPVWESIVRDEAFFMIVFEDSKGNYRARWCDDPWESTRHTRGKRDMVFASEADAVAWVESL